MALVIPHALEPQLEAQIRGRDDDLHRERRDVEFLALPDLAVLELEFGLTDAR